MKFLKHANEDHWWEWDTEKMKVYNYHGGWHDIDENSLGEYAYREFDSWHELYLATGFCPIEEDVYCCSAWLSPDGRFFEATAHACAAEEICELIFGKEIDIWEAEDFLEEHGWVRVTTSIMWEVRESYWFDKDLTQTQLDALWDWCELHNKHYPY